MAGRGHLTCAEAIRDEIISESPADIRVILYDPIKSSTKLGTALVELYNHMVARFPKLYEYYVQYLDLAKPYQSRSFMKHVRQHLQQLYLESKPNIVLSVYPMTNHIPLEIIEEMHLRNKIKFVTFITDPMGQILRGWANSKVDKILLCSDSCRQNIEDCCDIEKSKINLVRFPLRNVFNENTNVKKEAGRNKNHKIIVNCGHRGTDYVARVISHINRSDLDIVFICGSNLELKKLLENRFRKSRNVEIKGFCSAEEMFNIYLSSDFVFGKLGASTFFECMATNTIPLIDCRRTVLPQERDIVNYVESSGLGYKIFRDEDLSDSLRHAICHKGEIRKRIESVSESQRKLPNIAQILLSDL